MKASSIIYIRKTEIGNDRFEAKENEVERLRRRKRIEREGGQETESSTNKGLVMGGWWLEEKVLRDKQIESRSIHRSLLRLFSCKWALQSPSYPSQGRGTQAGPFTSLPHTQLPCQQLGCQWGVGGHGWEANPGERNSEGWIPAGGGICRNDHLH